MANGWQSNIDLGGQLALNSPVSPPAPPPTAPLQIPADAASLPGDVPVNMADRLNLLYRIRQAESNNSNAGYPVDKEGKALSSATGYYQMIKDTWDEGLKLAGFPPNWNEAKDAPPDVQDKVAMALLNARGTKPWDSSRHIWDRPDAQYVTGASGGFTDTAPIEKSLGQRVTAATNVDQPAEAKPGNQLAMAPPSPPFDMRQMMLMTALQTLLPKGFAFHPVDYDPMKVLERGRIAPPAPLGSFERPAVRQFEPVTAIRPQNVPRFGQRGPTYE